MNDKDKFLADLITGIIIIALFIYLVFFTGCTVNVQEADDSEFCFADYHCSYIDDGVYRSAFFCEEELHRYNIVSCW